MGIKLRLLIKQMFLIISTIAVIQCLIPGCSFLSFVIDALASVRADNAVRTVDVWTLALAGVGVLDLVVWTVFVGTLA